MAYSYQKPDKTAQLKDVLKAKGAPGGVWLLCGEESYLSAYYRDRMRAKIIPDPDLGYFDHIRLSGAEPGDAGLAAQIQTACAGLPVMNESKLIELAEPCFSDLTPTELAELCAVFASVPEYPYITVLIHCAEEEFPTVDYRAQTSSLWKALVQAGVQIIPFARQERAKLIPWCGKHFASEGIEAAPSVIELMIGRVGTSMSALAAEMEKLSAYVKANGRDTVSRDDVMLVCAVTESAEDFGLQAAVRARDSAALMREYMVAKHRHEEPLTLFFQISGAIMELWRVKNGLADGYSKEDLMRKLRMKEYPFKLASQAAANYSEDSLDRLATLCAQTDEALKSMPMDGYLLLERLICSIGKSFGA